VKGPPAKPIRGLAPSSPTRLVIASVTNGTSPGSSSRSRPTAAASRTGASTTGPTPGLMAIPTPIALSGTMMSLKKTAASTS
jgi:hypothetical protein